MLYLFYLSRIGRKVIIDLVRNFLLKILLSRLYR